MKRHILSFIQGFGWVVDFGGIFDRRERRKNIAPEERDYNAIKSDWEAVGNDLRWAIKNYHASKR